MNKQKFRIGFTLFISALVLSTALFAKDKKNKNKNKSGYQFTPRIEIATSSVKDQASSGTCWSFATTSFIETEIIRMGNGVHDISEMFFVRYAYPEKANKYLRYQGNANFSEGGQAHDVNNIIRNYGMVPEEVYTGLNYGLDYHKHAEMVAVLKGILDNSLKSQRNYTGKAQEVLNATLDIYLGKIPQEFNYQGKTYTPKSFAESMGFNPDDYIEFTSYSCYPFNTAVDLEIPDNWSHNLYYNVTINDLMRVINHAFDNGFSVNWDGDVSERGFSHRNGVAIIPEDDPQNMEDCEKTKWEGLSKVDQNKMLYDFSKPRTEKQITQEMRQKTFDIFKTTDDHLMHLVGTATDQNGTLYYLTKNSWADDSNNFGGKLYMSESYVKLKTIAIQVHKDAIPADIKEKLNIK